VSARLGILALVVAVLALAGDPVPADQKPSPREVLSFGMLKAPAADQVRAQALDWLKATGKADEAAFKSFETVWAQADRPLLDRVADTLALGDPEAARLLSEARNSTAPAPQEVPAVLKDAKRPAFFRANLALAYARALSQRRVYEEALAALRLVKPEEVVDPATYLFHRAVAEYALLNKDEASRAIQRLLDDATDSPQRYKLVGTLMYLDMQSWKTKDLGEIARKMDNIERRLDLARGGRHTQKLQREVVARLDELIKKMENQQKGSSQPNGGSCPNGGPPGGGSQQGGQPFQPQLDSLGGNNSGPGNVEKKKIDKLVQQWGKLPEKEKTKAMQDLTRELPPEYRELIEAYFRKLAQEPNRP
jgi:hypothetical protein